MDTQRGRLSNFPKVTQLVRGRAGHQAETQAVGSELPLKYAGVSTVPGIRWVSSEREPWAFN